MAPHHRVLVLVDRLRAWREVKRTRRNGSRRLVGSGIDAELSNGYWQGFSTVRADDQDAAVTDAWSSLVEMSPIL